MNPLSDFLPDRKTLFNKGIQRIRCEQRGFPAYLITKQPCLFKRGQVKHPIADRHADSRTDLAFRLENSVREILE